MTDGKQATQREITSADPETTDLDTSRTISGEGLKGFANSSAAIEESDSTAGVPGHEASGPLTREIIVSRARQILKEEGYRALSLRRLAGRLGVTAPALYGHVRDKRDLLESLGEDGYARLDRALLPFPDESPVAQIHYLAHGYLDFVRDNREQFRAMLLFDTEVISGASGSQLENTSVAFAEGTAAVSRAVELGLIASRDLRQTNLVIWGAVYGVTMTILAAQDILDREQEDRLLRATVAAVLKGLEPSKQPLKRFPPAAADCA